jgi:hypothetical protein
MFSRAERANHTLLLQDGTAHRWEEGMHLTGVFVHLNRIEPTNVSCFFLINETLGLPLDLRLLIHVWCWIEFGLPYQWQWRGAGRGSSFWYYEWSRQVFVLTTCCRQLWNQKSSLASCLRNSARSGRIHISPKWEKECHVVRAIGPQALFTSKDISRTKNLADWLPLTGKHLLRVQKG